jgi:hypothetical protein
MQLFADVDNVLSTKIAIRNYDSNDKKYCGTYIVSMTQLEGNTLIQEVLNKMVQHHRQTKFSK